MGILSWLRSRRRSRRRRAERRARLAAKIFEGLTRRGLPGWSEEDCAQIADLLAERCLALSRERAWERWARWELIRLSKAGG
jgi:hypothetical protein